MNPSSLGKGDGWAEGMVALGGTNRLAFNSLAVKMLNKFISCCIGSILPSCQVLTINK